MARGVSWGMSEAPLGIEPTMGDLQSPALPLGDGAEVRHHGLSPAIAGWTAVSVLVSAQIR